jgi:DNA-binding transcriptional MocR family regulator
MELLLEKTEAMGLSVAPGHAFFPGKNDQVNIRICFTPVTEARLTKGMALLRETLRQMHSAFAQEPLLEPAARMAPPASF